MGGVERQRYVVLDSYRFIAAMGVVLYHFEAHLTAFLPYQTNVLDRFQTLVDLFFVLSGFVLMHSYNDSVGGWTGYAAFLRRRFARVYPLHLATILLCVALFVAVTAAHVPVRDPSLIDTSQLVPNLLLIHAWGLTARPALNFPSWSISAEAFVYLLFPVLAWAAARLRPLPSLGLAVLLVCAIEAVRAASGLRSGSVATFDYGMIRAVPMFLAGIATCGLVSSLSPPRVSWLYPHGLAVLILALMLARAPYYAIDTLYPVLVGLIAAAERGGRPTRLGAPLMVRLGEASFAIYMVHTFVQVGCVAVVRRLGWSGVPALTLVAAVGACVIVGCGLASYRVFETPMRRWLGGARQPAVDHEAGSSIEGTGREGGLVRASNGSSREILVHVGDLSSTATLKGEG